VLASGNVIAGSAKSLASVAVGIAVKHGARKPDISTPAAVKQLLLGAKSVSYPDPVGGASGTQTRPRRRQCDEGGRDRRG
jgi:molybdate transport system substrate-binding protein